MKSETKVSLKNFNDFAAAAGLSADGEIPCYKFIEGVALNYHGPTEGDNMLPPGYGHGGIVLMDCMKDIKIRNDQDTEDGNNAFQYKEGTKLSKFLQFLVFCHQPTNGATKLSVEEFQDKLTSLNNDTKKAMSEVDKYTYGLPHEYHTDRVEFLISKEGVVTGDQGQHGDEVMPYRIGTVPCQDNTKPTVTLRRNNNFKTDSMDMAEGLDVGEVLGLLDRMSDCIISVFEIPTLKDRFLKVTSEDHMQFDGQLKVYFQTLLLPCFQCKEAILKYKKREDVLVIREEPCCDCAMKGIFCSKGCHCKTTSNSYCSTLCKAIPCKNSQKWVDEKKAYTKAVKEAKKNKQPLPEKLEEKYKRERASKSQNDDNEDNEDEFEDGDEDGSEGRNKSASQYVQANSHQMNVGDLLIIPGSGPKGLLHYGVKRNNKVQVAFTCCPKVTNPKIPKHSSGKSGRSHTMFLLIMSHFWEILPRNKKFEMRLQLLRWFTIYICLNLCNGRRISNELTAYPGIHAMLRDIEDIKLNFKEENQDEEEEENQDDEGTDINKIVLPTKERLCFSPHPDDIEPYDYSSNQPEPERSYTFTDDFEKACQEVFDFIETEEYHKKNDLCHLTA
jgi:hypothetical protein